MVLVLKYGESNAIGSALNTWQMPQTVRFALYHLKVS